VDTQPQTSPTTTIEEDILFAHHLIAEHFVSVGYPPDEASDYIFALARSLECLVSERVQLLVMAFGYHLSRGGHTRFIKENFIGRARRGLTIREVVWYSYKAGRYHDPPVSNTGVADPTAKGGT